MTAKPDKLRLYYTSQDLTAHGDSLPDRTVTTGSMSTIVTESIEQETGYWNGAIGFFTENSNALLRGVFFHVTAWNADNNTLTLATSLPATPTAGDTFRLVKSGKYASSQEIPGLLVSGKQPEFNTISGTNISGLTITKASAALGEGTLMLNYTYSSGTKTIQMRMGSDIYGANTTLAETGDYILYDANENAWVQINVVFGSLPTSNKTDTFTLAIPRGVFMPNVEAYDSADTGGRTRYYLVAAKNIGTNTNDSVSGFGVWTNPQSSSTAIIQSGAPNSNTAATIVLSTTPADFPTKGFWIRNVTKNDYRFVLNRVGNTLYTKAFELLLWSFTNGNTNLVIGQNFTKGLSYNQTQNGKLFDVMISSGSLENGNAQGTLIIGSRAYLVANTAPLYDINNNTACNVNGTQTQYAQRNANVVSWTVNDIIEVASELDIAVDPNGETFLSAANEYQKPDLALNFLPRYNIDNRVIIGSLGNNETAGIWVKQEILPNVPAHENLIGNLCFSWY